MSAVASDERTRREQLAAAIDYKAKLLREFEDSRRHPHTGDDLLAHETKIARVKAELEQLQTEFAELIRQADEREAERARIEAEEKEAARPGLEAQLREFAEVRDEAFRQIEAAIDKLVPAIDAALTIDAQLRSVDVQLGGHGKGRIKQTISDRIVFRLHDVGYRELEYVLGNTGREPLAEPLAEPVRSSSSRTTAAAKPIPKGSLPAASTEKGGRQSGASTRPASKPPAAKA